MLILDTFTRKMARFFYGVAGLAILAMMLLTVLDVIMRMIVTLYQKTNWEFLTGFSPVPGTYELVGFLGSVAVAFAMAHTSIQKGHVSVSLIVRLLSPRKQAAVGAVTDAFALAFFSIIVWRAYLYADHMRELGEVSLTLQLPFYPFVWGIGLGAFAVCLVVFSDLTRNLAKVFGK